MEMDISYSQIAIFDAALDEPFNDWTEEAVTQGLSEAGRSVSFGMPADGTVLVTYEIGAETQPMGIEFSKTLTSVIEVAGGKGIEIATITQSHAIEAENGTYTVEFGILIDGDIMKCHFAITSLPWLQDQRDGRILS